ncbi:MAG: TetR/AcrR family transcriptional regulator [Deltaproteobacteria bacterium]|nr:TetR/AcrR family transcriptional regulator [Deltaproteobacteria bacterium]MBT4267221.1 TetR/AcrR family transcriptional regulator [Deltaproteobacteria bacterium]MBT4642585.1 TetR/AcrR family transcriptional regulator [Deltaproteobacteria bacterium]MBT6503071.1 TetR/AcrR family transcriptional regulator [Deltaproteobacteria bacterium]MBT6613597.1 TetR/AcrR family transcriptional regulator [Deltaproteobacteria bacterium]
MEKMTDRQSQIIAESINLISEKGIQGLTIKNLAKKIEVTEPAIYRHFASKMDILVTILDTFKLEKQVVLTKIAVNNISAIQKLEEIFTYHFSSFNRNPAMAAVIFSEEIFNNDDRLSGRVLAIMETSQQIMLGILDNGQHNGELRNDISAEQIALVLMGSLRLLVKRWRLTGLSFDLEKKGDELWHSLKKMIAPD